MGHHYVRPAGRAETEAEVADIERKIRNRSYIAPAHLGVSPFFGQSLLLIPILCFWILYPNWGATLYGEVRGAGDFRGVLRGMLAGLWVTFAIAIVFLFLVEKTFGCKHSRPCGPVFE